MFHCDVASHSPRPLHNTVKPRYDSQQWLKRQRHDKAYPLFIHQRALRHVACVVAFAELVDADPQGLRVQLSSNRSWVTHIVEYDTIGNARDLKLSEDLQVV